MRRHRIRRILIVLASAVGVAAVALTLVAVLAPAGAQESTTTTDSSASERSGPWRDEVEACLSEHGIDVPEPETDADGSRVRPNLTDEQRQAVRDALADCGIHRRHHGHLRHRAHRAVKECVDSGQGSREECRAEVKQKVEAFVSCMGEHGIERGWRRDHRPLDKAERTQLRAAIEECRPTAAVSAPAG